MANKMCGFRLPPGLAEDWEGLVEREGGGAAVAGVVVEADRRTAPWRDGSFSRWLSEASSAAPPADAVPAGAQEGPAQAGAVYALLQELREERRAVRQERTALEVERARLDGRRAASEHAQADAERLLQTAVTRWVAALAGRPGGRAALATALFITSDRAVRNALARMAQAAGVTVLDATAAEDPEAALAELEEVVGRRARSEAVGILRGLPPRTVLSAAARVLEAMGGVAPLLDSVEVPGSEEPVDVAPAGLAALLRGLIADRRLTGAGDLEPMANLTGLGVEAP